MKVRNSNYREDVQAVFENATFIRRLGIRCIDVQPGCCRAELNIVPEHLQHLDRVHGGVLSSLAGHAALGAAMSIVLAGEVLVAPEFTFKLFRAVDSGLVEARATVLKGGALLVFVEAEVLRVEKDATHLVAKGSFTFTRIKKS